MNFLKRFCYKRKLRQSKESLLHDIDYDLAYIKTFQLKALHADTKELRATLSQQNALKREEKDYDQDLINRTSDEISQAEAVQGEYEKLMVLKGELRDYLSLL